MTSRQTRSISIIEDTNGSFSFSVVQTIKGYSAPTLNTSSSPRNPTFETREDQEALRAKPDTRKPKPLTSSKPLTRIRSPKPQTLTLAHRCTCHLALTVSYVPYTRVWNLTFNPNWQVRSAAVGRGGLEHRVLSLSHTHTHPLPAPPSVSLSPSLFLSLFLTHTHAHTHTAGTGRCSGQRWSPTSRA